MMSPGTILIPWPLTSAGMPGDICMTHDMIMTRHYDPMPGPGSSWAGTTPTRPAPPAGPRSSPASTPGVSASSAATSADTSQPVSRKYF